MNIHLLTVGNLKEGYLRDAQKEYLKRLSRFCRFQVAEVQEEKADEKGSEALDEQVRKKEGERLIKALPKNAYTIAMTIDGESPDSEHFANKLDKLMLDGKSDIAFIIGGSTGLSREIEKNADLKLSLSKMTFPHQLARIILLEQIYRAFKIIRGETYHK